MLGHFLCVRPVSGMSVVLKHDRITDDRMTAVLEQTKGTTLFLAR